MKLLYKESSLISDEKINQTAETLSAYTDHLQEVVKTGGYEAPEASINLVDDAKLLEEVKALAQKMVTPDLKYIIDIGIGGSNLGTKAIYDRLYGFFDMLEPERMPKMLFCDTNDPEFLQKLVSFLQRQVAKPEEISLCAISKSGGTTETMVNFEIIFQTLVEKFQNMQDRTVVITDEGSKLWEKVGEKNVSRLAIPKNVGGRFSVFSAVGLFPLVAAGMSIEKLLDGAREMREVCLSSDSENPALASAVVLYCGLQEGRTINDNFLFHPELESLGKWYRQLMGESVGKEQDLDGKTMYAGITPTVSIGSTDLHSVGQLYLGGPKDKITTFITSLKNASITVPAKLSFDGLVSHIEGKEASVVMDAIATGVKIAYQKKQRAFMEVILDDISEKSLGEFMMFKMIEIMYLGKLLNVNTFDQPNVEDYKVETKKILSK